MDFDRPCRKSWLSAQQLYGESIQAILAFADSDNNHLESSLTVSGQERIEDANNKDMDRL